VQTLDDAGYQSDINASNLGYSDTQSSLQNKEYQLRSQAGFDPEFANNPYTQANMLARRANQRFNSTTNGMAARGQLYSGATSRARDADTFTSGGELDDARRGYNEGLSGIAGDRLAAERGKSAGYDKAYLGMLDRAQKADPDASLFPQEPIGGKKGKPGRGKQPPAKKKSPYAAKRSMTKAPVDPGFYRNPIRKKGK